MLTRVLVLLALGASAGGAPAQACVAELPSGHRVETAAYALAYRTQPDAIHVGRHFTIEFVVCPKAGAATVESVDVGAFMPEHNHGMNYKPVIAPMGQGRFRAEGLMFHMPGRWDINFDIKGGGRTERLTRSTVLK